MSTHRVPRPSFEITAEGEPSTRLVAGFSSFGLAGLTAVDYLVDYLDLDEIGHVTSEELPAITPFEEGAPRHHTRLFSRSDLDLTVLVNELFVPVWAADSFSEAILGWTDANGVEEITVLSGVPVAHGPDDHRVFYVATGDYREDRLRDADVPPMGNGFLEGVNASLVGRGMDTALRVGVLTTPVHAQAPDAEAALRLVDAFGRLQGLEVDTDALAQFAAEIQQHYRNLAERLESVRATERPEDRMYM